MRKEVYTYVALAATLVASSCQKDSLEQEAHFKYFKYVGSDEIFNNSINDGYRNPIISGFYPDPSICRKDNDYYLVNSSFAYYPGVPIWHSTDLVNWKQLGYVLNRPSQLNIKNTRLSGGIYAPDIQYNPFNDTFYLITTAVDMGGNFYVTTKNPQSGIWSDPTYLPEVGGIDPSFLFDNDGKAYIVNNDAPAGSPEYDGHRAIWIHDFDTKTGKVVGQSQVIIDKGVDPKTKPIWIEGPHLYHINNLYYLMAAEGGTSEMHSEVVFSSDSPKGPFKPCNINPILTQRDLRQDRQNPITCTGHADLIQTPDGDWFAVFLGCRPYQDGCYNTGRETFMLPVKWEHKQPIILNQGDSVPLFVAYKHSLDTIEHQTGNFTEIDSFSSSELSKSWSFIRTPKSQWYSSGNGLSIKTLPISISQISTPAFIGQRIKHQTFEVETEIRFSPNQAKSIAGLVCYQNESHYYLLGISLDHNNTPVVSLIKQNNDSEIVASLSIPDHDTSIRLKMKGNKEIYTFYVSFNNGNQWIQLGGSQDGKILSTLVAGGFSGAMVGLYASSAQ